MPGATTAMLVFLVSAIELKLFMMPHTVPNRPMKGAVEPTVARKPRYFSSCSISRASASCIAWPMRSRIPACNVPSGASPLSVERRHSCIAEANNIAIGWAGWLPMRL